MALVGLRRNLMLLVFGLLLRNVWILRKVLKFEFNWPSGFRGEDV